jgi:hypothetical protein
MLGRSSVSVEAARRARGSVDALRAVYFIAFLVGGGLGVASWLLGDHGHAHGADGAHGHGHGDGHDGHAQPFLNMMSLSALCCAGGGAGLIVQGFGGTVLLGIASASGAGIAAAFGINALLGWLARGTRYAAPLPRGIVGTVVARVGPGVGEIVYVQNGARASMPARSDDGRTIERDTEVIVLAIENGIARVAPAAALLNKED